MGTELLRVGANTEVNLLEENEMENIFGGKVLKCDEGYHHSILIGTTCECGYSKQ